MKIKQKGKKVHPTPPQTAVQNSLSVLNLLPAAILAIITVLSFQEREVLAYMMTRSLKTNTTGSIRINSSSLKKTSSFHKPPVFDCECFECYTSFWFRWDSSPNREVIHQAIEAFDEVLASGELETKRSGKKKEKLKLSSPTPSIVNEAMNLPVKETVAEGQMKVEDEEAVAAVVARVATAEGHHKGFARKVLPDVLGVFNSRLWNLWGPNV